MKQKERAAQALAQSLDPECWNPYEGLSAPMQEYMEQRRFNSLMAADRLL